MLGAIEAGGTKFVCAVSDNDLNIVEKITIPTTVPDETFSKVFELFDKYDLSAIGIGSFGPIDLNKESPTYGFITSTPKKNWKNTDFLSEFKNRYNIPIGWDTDVNAAALGESILGNGINRDSCVYITVGTGIGGGWVVNQCPQSNYGHAEMGHFFVPRHKNDDFEGVCDHHKDCLEGLASGPSIKKRHDEGAETLDEDHCGWEFEAHYLAHAALAITCLVRPECIIFGGGVMQREHLLDMVKEKFSSLLNNYLDIPPLDEYILPTGLGTESGILGSLLLAKHFSE